MCKKPTDLICLVLLLGLFGNASKAATGHVREFKDSLINKGTSEKQACLVHNRTKNIIGNCEFIYIDDVSGSKVQKYLAECRHKSLSIRSSNFYLQAIKQFLNWMVADGRTGENPLAFLRGQNPKEDSDINLTMSRYTHTLRGQEARAIEALPDLSRPSKNQEQQKATGTDGIAYKPAYKKLAKNAYFDNNQLAENGTAHGVESIRSSGFDVGTKSLSNRQLDNECLPLTTTDRRGRDSNPRYQLKPVRRFSKPLP